MQRVIIIIIAVMISFPIVLKSRESGYKSPPAAFSVLSSNMVSVRVGGAVRHAGIYKVSANTLTNSVINMAIVGGNINNLVPDYILFLPVANGGEIFVKELDAGVGAVTVGSMSANDRFVLGIPLDINSMSEEDFDRLPGVGPVMARRIVGYRQKNGGKMKVEDLATVAGIGEMMYQKLKKYF